MVTSDEGLSQFTLPPETVAYYSQPNSVNSSFAGNVEVRVQGNTEREGLHSDRRHDFGTVSKLNTCEDINYATLATIPASSNSASVNSIFTDVRSARTLYLLSTSRNLAL